MPPSETRPAALRRRPDRLPPRRRRAAGRYLLAGLLTVLYLLEVWVLGLGGDDPVDWIQPLPGLLGASVGAAFLRWAGNRQARRIRRLLDQLPDQPPRGVGAPAG